MLRVRSFSHSSGRELRLCGDCARWLADLARETAVGAAEGLVAAPRPYGVLVFDDQCALCRAIPCGDPWVAEVVTWLRAGPSWRGPTLCRPCALWLLALARDGRTAQGSAARRAEDEYGAWLQPHLPPLALSLLVEDAEARRLVREVAQRIPAAAEAEPVPLVVREIPPSGTAELPPADGPAPELWLVPARAAARLPELLHEGVADWRTLPVTPQQVVGGIELAVREWCGRSSWVRPLALRLVDTAAVTEPFVVFEAPPGTELETVWLLRRFARGQDALGALPDGRIALLPRGGGQAAPAVAERLGYLLDVRASVVHGACDGPRLDVRG